MQLTRVEATLLRSARCWLAYLLACLVLHGTTAVVAPVTNEHCCCSLMIVAALACLQVLQDEGSQALVSSSAKRPTGRIVGVIRRNWRTRGYAGNHLAYSTTHAGIHHIMPVDMHCVISAPQSIVSVYSTNSPGIRWNSSSGCCCCLQAACNPASGGRLPTAPHTFCSFPWSASSH